MKQISPERYSIAWFKLAECVARGEKERALGVYRLLSHSIDDVAFTRQLEGDIFLSFNEQVLAQERYKEAALLYKKDNRLLETASIYEQLLSCDGNNADYMLALIELYHELALVEKYQLVMFKLCTLIATDKSAAEGIALIDRLVLLVGEIESAAALQQLICVLLNEPDRQHSALIMSYITKMLDHVCNIPAELGLLQKFLVILEQTDILYYRKAKDYLALHAQ